jgi:hypothetical protein
MKRVACRLWPTGPVSAGAAAGDNERALALIDEGLAMADEGGQHFWDAIASAAKSCSSDHPTPRPPKKPTRRPSLWRSDRARSYEVLASLSLAKLYQSTARPDEAYAVLAPAVEGFTPSPEMPEIAKAQTLLESLARGGEEAIPSKGQATKG